jgi:hypothetical protein
MGMYIPIFIFAGLFVIALTSFIVWQVKSSRAEVRRMKNQK